MNNPNSQLCADCRDDHRVSHFKKFEVEIALWLEESGLNWSYSNKKLPSAPTTRYPDFVFATLLGHIVILEVDEHQHSSYISKCEIARLSELMDSINGASLHVIRYNPHSKVTRDELFTAITNAIETDFGALHDSGCAVQYLGYSEDRIIHLDELTCELQKV